MTIRGYQELSSQTALASILLVSERAVRSKVTI